MFLGPVEVTLEPDESLGAGEFLIASDVVEGPGGGPIGALVLGDGSRVQMGEEPLSIGRSPDSDVVLPDAEVSRHHAEVRRQDGAFVLVDLGSMNGTRVNGAGVRERQLQDGDEITIGSTKLRFEAM
jgi:pSer/pThr/pTyr-binding forkhead associated (FHA) protein